MEGQNIVVEYRAAGGVVERLPELAAELVDAHVDVIVAAPATAPARAARDATSTIPIVLLGHTDPVGQRLAASLARPGGNVTDLASGAASGMTGKRLELLTEVVPGISRVGLLRNPDEAGQREVLAGAMAAARVLGVEVPVVPARAADEFDSAFRAIVHEGAQAVYLLGASIFDLYRSRIAALAIQHRLPSTFAVRQFADAGGLMTYGPNFPDLARRGALYVDKILKGAKPADLPIEQPTTFDFVINLKTAQALGLTIPQHVLLQATEVIQ